MNDSLQRYRMALTYPYDIVYFYDKSIKKGDSWLKRNKKYYNRCNNLTRIIRWDHWLKHAKYKDQYQSIKLSIENDPVYKAIFNHTTEALLQKHKKLMRLAKASQHHEPNDIEQLYSDFILEACIAMTLWSELQCRFEACPTLHNRAIEETRRRFIKTKDPNLLTHLCIGFKKIASKGLRPYII
jgi:hypothetical protein